MSDSVNASISLKKKDGSITNADPADLKKILENSIRFESISVSISVKRPIPRDKFDRNEYFETATINLLGMYDMVDVKDQMNDPLVKKTIAEAILSKTRKAFDLCRIGLKEQQEADGITVVSLASKTNLDA